MEKTINFILYIQCQLFKNYIRLKGMELHNTAQAMMEDLDIPEDKLFLKGDFEKLVNNINEIALSLASTPPSDE